MSEPVAAPEARPTTTLRRIGVALLLAAIGGGASLWSSSFIEANFADRPLPRDLLLAALPYTRVAQYAADGLVALAMFVMIVYFMLRRRDDIPEVVSMFAVMYALRSAINVLTPLASPHQQELYGWFPSQNGMFPSGHSANVLLCWLVLDRTAPKALRVAAFAIAAAEWVALLVSRGHYSIDVLGGILLGYFVWAEWTRGSLFARLRVLVAAQSRS